MNKVETKILDISSNYYNYLLNLENVNGVGCGFKYINQTNTKEPCIHVLVENKLKENYLTKNNRIPKFYMGIKTDVVNAGKFVEKVSSLFNPILGKIRPLEGGYDVSAVKDIGTIGCIVTNIVDDEKQYYILSNNHTIAARNKMPIGSPIYQPSLYYSGYSHKEEVAKLSNFIPIKYGRIKFFLKKNYVDCAIAKITNKAIISNKIAKIGKVKGVGVPSLGLLIKKVGAVSGLTEGKIITVGTTIISQNSDGYYALFKNQILGKIGNLHGDSGSVILNQNNEVLGLFYSGSQDNSTMAFSDISIVLDKLKVKIYT